MSDDLSLLDQFKAAHPALQFIFTGFAGGATVLALTASLSSMTGWQPDLKGQAALGLGGSVVGGYCCYELSRSREKSNGGTTLGTSPSLTSKFTEALFRHFLSLKPGTQTGQAIQLLREGSRYLSPQDSEGFYDPSGMGYVIPSQEPQPEPVDEEVTPSSQSEFFSTQSTTPQEETVYVPQSNQPDEKSCYTSSSVFMF